MADAIVHSLETKQNAHALVASDEKFRQAPHNLEAEQALLGAILINNEAFDRVADFLKAEHFALDFHGELFALIKKIIELNKLASPVTIKPFLDANKLVGELPAFNYVVRLATDAVTVINALDYGRMIYDLFVRRTLIELGEEIVNTAYDAPVDFAPNQQIEAAEQRLYSIAENGQYGGGFENFSESVKKAIDMASAAHRRSSKLSGIPTHIKTLDARMGGLQRSDLIILAGRPGMGKSSLATNIAVNVADSYKADDKGRKADDENEGGVVGFFSLEMSSEQLATRIMAEQAEISSAKMRRGDLTEDEFSKLLRSMRRMQQIPLYIDQTGGISIAQLAARARRQKRQHGLDVLIIDYIQLMTGSTRRSSENRVQEITEITTGLKALAKELNVPIIALSQLSRQVENREDKRPQLSDLRESGSIEQDADVVLFIYREEYYLKNKEPKMGTEEHLKWQTAMEDVFGKAEVIIAKQRHGPTGTVKLAFQSEFTSFTDLAEEDHLPEQFR